MPAIIPFLDVLTSPFMFLIFGISIRLFADLMFAMFFVPFISSRIFGCFLLSNRFRFRLRGGVLVEPVSVNIRAHAVTSRFESLDPVDLTDVFQFKASIMQNAPKFLHRAYRAALRQAIDGVNLGWERNDVDLQVRAWKLFLLVPRMLLSRPRRRGLVPRKTIEERIALFQSGERYVLVEMSLDSSVQAATVR